MKKVVKVVAAIIENDEKEILCALRSSEMSIPNKWEFPGGKLEIGETLFAAIEREIAEELQCKVVASAVFNEHTHEYDACIITLISIKCRIIEGTPHAIEHAKLIWLKRENLLSLQWAPADIPAVEQVMNEK